MPDLLEHDKRKMQKHPRKIQPSIAKPINNAHQTYTRIRNLITDSRRKNRKKKGTHQKCVPFFGRFAGIITVRVPCATAQSPHGHDPDRASRHNPASQANTYRRNGYAPATFPRARAERRLRSRIFQRGPSPMSTKRTVMSSPISTKRTL